MRTTKKSKHLLLLYHARQMNNLFKIDAPPQRLRWRMKRITEDGWRRKAFWKFYYSIYNEKHLEK